MFERATHFALLLFAIFCVTGCTDEKEEVTDAGPSGSPRSDIVNVVQSYRELDLMTPEPVYVNPELARLCVGASKEMVDRARLDKGPHANSVVKIFMNEAASTAFHNGTPYPVGSIVVKEKNMLGYRTKTDTDRSGAGNGIGGMVKRTGGFDDANGNWEYFYTENDSEIEFGAMDSCVQCHAKTKDTDYVFGTWANGNDQLDTY